MSSLPHRPPENGDRQAAIDDLMDRIAASAGAGDEWWNLSTYEGLGGRTPHEALLAGDNEAVVRLIDTWYERTEVSAERIRNNPTLLRTIEDRRRLIADKTGHPRTA